MRMRVFLPTCSALGMLTLLACCDGLINGFATRALLDSRLLVTPDKRRTSSRTSLTLSSDPQSSWDVADDWQSLSAENRDNRRKYNVLPQDIPTVVAREMEEYYEKTSQAGRINDEDHWLDSIVDGIVSSINPSDPPLYDTGFESSTEIRSFEDEMGTQITMLVRCNESPESILIDEGRALPPLSKEELNDIAQLVDCESGVCQPTDFFANAVSQMFFQHADTVNESSKIPAMSAIGVASWMTQALASEDNSKVSVHDKRVVETVSRYGTYGKGYLQEHQFLQLYLEAVIGNKPLQSVSMLDVAKLLKFRTERIDAVFRDIRSHGILTPVETHQQELEEELRNKHGAATVSESQERSLSLLPWQSTPFMDECEILDWRNHYNGMSSGANAAKNAPNASSEKSSSHKNLFMVPGKDVPAYIQDGQFVFIDEESCIGCMQCAIVSPSSFLMLENGRARTFDQRAATDIEQAIQSCPVDCMHRVGYKELVKLEESRDKNDGKTDHQHLSRPCIPLHVAMRDTSASHCTSLYHTIKQQCLTTANCPQQGCYDCPKYNNPGDNPHWKDQRHNDNHIRAEYFNNSGKADAFRRTADL